MYYFLVVNPNLTTVDLEKFNEIRLQHPQHKNITIHVVANFEEALLEYSRYRKVFTNIKDVSDLDTSPLVKENRNRTTFSGKPAAEKFHRKLLKQQHHYLASYG